MKFFNSLSIKSKMTAIIMLTSCIALLAACLVLLVYEVISFRKIIVRQSSMLAEITGKNCGVYVPINEPSGAEKILANLASDKRIVSACIYATNGTIWARFPKSTPDSDFKEKSGGENASHRFNSSGLHVFSPILDDPGVEFIGMTYIHSNLSELYSRVYQYIGAVVVVLLLSAVMALLISARVQRLISQPVLELSETARTVSDKKDYTVRAQKYGDDEVGTLIDSFNEMLAQIQKRDIELQEARVAAERANQAKSNFLSFMSHELRTPLTAIIGFSEMLISEVEAEGRREWVEDLRRVHDSGRYLLELINDILDISKIEAGKMDVHFETFNVATLVHDLKDVLRPLVERKHNRLVVECADDIGSMYADRIKVRQCLLNLLSNASKFTENGAITLSVSRSARNGSDWLAFRVQDTGIGMTQEQIGKIFRAFTHGDDSTSRRYGGTGLGLALTKEFCQMMGGNVSVESEPAKGSTFTIALPAVVAKANSPAPLVQQASLPTVAKARSSEGCILIIDDDPAIHRLLADTLGPEGYTLKFATNGADGLRLAKELRPVVITLDVIMPGMDGWMVLSLLKADPELAMIPVIMLTVRADQDFGFALGVADYLQKPIDPNRLVAVLKKYHRLRSSNHVLVVEDDPAMREMFCRMLEIEDWTVVEAANGLAALESITRSPPSLILLDLKMPVMDGFQMIAELHKHEDWRKIPVVVVSGKELTPEDRHQLEGYVQKTLQKGDFAREELMREVRQTVRLFLADQKAIEL